MRRRLHRRPSRRIGPRRVPPALRRANTLMENENHAETALAFAKLAQRTEAKRGARAPIFHLRVGIAYILAGDIEKGMRHLKHGLTMMAAKRQWEPLQRFGKRTADELKESGHKKEAQEIFDHLKKALPEKPHKKKVGSRPPLLTQWPNCGAPIHSDEVIWIDQETTECAFCGNPVRGED